MNRREPRVAGGGLAVALAVILVLALVPKASATSITSAGPLTTINVSTTLNCQVETLVDWQFYYVSGGDACGTFLAVGGTLYSPGSCPACGLTSTPFTPVTQTAVTGTGLLANPYEVTTQVTGGTFRVVQDDQYVIGQSFYSTNVTLTNTGGSAAPFHLYHAADCLLDGNDDSNGTAMPFGPSSIACSLAASSTAGPFISFDPVTAGATYQEDSFGAIWAAVDLQGSFANTCTCSTYLDSGMGIEWSGTLAAGASATYWFFTRTNSTIDPTAIFTALPNPACLGQSVTFVDQSFASPPRTLVSFEWDFGDLSPHVSGTVFPATTTHTYAAIGAYTVVLNVTDSAGHNGTTSQKVIVNSCFNPCPSMPGWTAVFGDNFATDPNLPPSPWDIYRFARDPPNEATWVANQVHLTTQNQAKGSAMFAKVPLPVNNPWEVRFKYNIGGGTGALGGGGDGLMFHFMRDTSKFNHLPAGPEIMGGRVLGFNPPATTAGLAPLAQAGYGIEFLGNGVPVLDPFPNGQISLVHSGNLLPTQHIQTVASGLVEDNVWHQVKVEYTPGWPSQLKVSIAPVPGAYTTVLTYQGSALPAGGDYIGFSATTDVAMNHHIIDDVAVCLLNPGVPAPPTTPPPPPPGDPCTPQGPFSLIEDFTTNPFTAPSPTSAARWNRVVASGNAGPFGTVDQWVSANLPGSSTTPGHVVLTDRIPGLFAGIEAWDDDGVFGHLGPIARGYVWIEFDYFVDGPGGDELRWYLANVSAPLGNLTAPLLWVSLNGDPQSFGALPLPVAGLVTINGDPSTARPRSPPASPLGGVHHVVIILRPDANPGAPLALGGDVDVYVDASPWTSAPAAHGRHNLPNVWWLECGNPAWGRYDFVAPDPSNPAHPWKPTLYNWGFAGKTSVATNVHSVDDIYVFQG